MKSISLLATAVLKDVSNFEEEENESSSGSFFILLSLNVSGSARVTSFSSGLTIGLKVSVNNFSAASFPCFNNIYFFRIACRDLAI